ncbi:YfdX family protein [Pseudoruegeria sp. SK021]|uniref:YfdX family protein n=1 Tax=Pseudoruegeria sp. SK021 TaxID=1933035 RepID=UPI000A24F492|nr:YfdX family protein [Pseudoruegeria sp. SK021]OSP55977.1 hypothetical protein BV911_04840 [Pseudoruegeria sp. SK021]
MKPISTLRRVAFATLIASSAAAPMALFAAEPATTQAAASTYSTQTGMLKTAEEALVAISSIHSARLALFNNELDTAKTDLSAAKTALEAAKADAADKMMRDFQAADNTGFYLPFDLNMALSETFVPTPDDQVALQKAAELFQTEAADEAIEVLRVASIDLQVSAALLPYDSTVQNLEAAIGNIEAGKYFEANIDLKAVEDSVIVRDFSIDAVPAQGNT